MTQTVRVLVADDHPAVRAAFLALLSAADGIEVVGAEADGPSALEAARALGPDVVLTDVRMPGATGIEITPRLRETGARVLVVSAFDLDAYVLDALAAGADGYLVKTERPERIVAAVRAVASGDAVLSPAATRAVVRSLQGAAHGPSAERTGPGEPAVALTGREEDVLRLIARGCSNQEIARELYVEVTTVKTHVTNALAKLGVTSRVQAALWWHEHRA